MTTSILFDKVNNIIDVVNQEIEDLSTTESIMIYLYMAELLKKCADRDFLDMIEEDIQKNE